MAIQAETTIIAIDPSINDIGVCFKRGGKETSCVIHTRGKSVEERLVSLKDQLLDLIITWKETNDCPISVAVIEEPDSTPHARVSIGNKQLNVRALLILSRAVGVIQLIVAMQRIPQVTVPASGWKRGLPKGLAMSITGKKDHNAADAIMLARWYASRSAGMPVEMSVALQGSKARQGKGYGKGRRLKRA